MLRSRKKRLDRGTFLFEQMNSALLALGFADSDVICPICGKGFNRDDLDARILTLEHVPPKSQGGKALLLTCKACNSFAGHSFEVDADDRSRLAHQVRGLLGGQDGTLGWFRMRVGGDTVNVEVSREASTTVLKASNRHNDPASLEAIQARLAEFTQGSEFTLTAGRGFRPKRAWIADLKAAFLLCTAKFGYSYALNANLQGVREQLLQPTDTTFPLHYLLECDLPPSTILVSETENLVALQLGEHAIALPWVGYSEDVPIEYSAAVMRGTLKGRLSQFPAGFEAQCDHARQLRG